MPPVEDWPVLDLRELAYEVKKTHEECGQWLFIWDKTEQVDTFFKYKGMMNDFFFQVQKVEN